MILLAALIKSALLVSLFLLAFRKILIRPLKNLMQQVEEIELTTISDHRIQLPFKNNNELELLESNINEMLDKLSTETKKAVNSEKLKFESMKNMAGAIAHRFNNSMFVILGSLEVINMSLPATSKEKKMASVAEYEANKTARVGHMMLSYTGNLPINPKNANLSELTVLAALKLKKNIPENISLELSQSPEALHCYVDKEQIDEVLSCILQNSVDALEGQAGTISVDFAIEHRAASSFPYFFQSENLLDGKYCVCKIADNGQGIAEEDMDKIFDPFFTTKFLGRGAGLALAAGIIRSHKGAISVQSDIGKGTVVRIYLPMNFESYKT